MALVKINGRLKFFDAVELTVDPISNGRWVVRYSNSDPASARSFIVVGGRKSGGASNEWFCHHPEFFGDQWVPAKSMVEAIKLGVAY